MRPALCESSRRVDRPGPRRYPAHMARWWGTVALAVALSVLGACGFADDNYQAAQAELDNSRPVLTVKATTTSAAPLPTLTPEQIRKVPVRRATPEEVASNLAAEAQARADEAQARLDAAAGRSGSRSGSRSGRTVGRRPFRPGPGTTAPATITTITTTTTAPLSPLCFNVRTLQVTGGRIVMSRDLAPAAYRQVVADTSASFRRMVALMPADQRGVGEQVGAAFSDVENRAAAAGSTAEIRAAVQSFMRSEGRRITEVLKIASFLCPQVISSGVDQAETIVIDG